MNQSVKSSHCLTLNLTEKKAVLDSSGKLCYIKFMRIAIVDDEKLICEGLKIIFQSYPDIEVIATGSNGNDALKICEEKNPELLLMDIRMPECNGVEATKKIKKSFSDIKILILTTFNDTEYIQKALQYGASGYLLKDSSPDVIYDGIKAAISGNIVINPEVAKTMLFENHEEAEERVIRPLSEIQNEFGLSQKEIEIIRLVSEGLSNKQIAYKQGLSEGTIKNNISVIFDKTFVSDRTQLAAFAFKNGIV